MKYVLSLSLRNLLRLNDVAAATTSNNYFLVTRTVVLGAAEVVIRYDYGGGELEDGKHISEQSRYRLENSSFLVMDLKSSSLERCSSSNNIKQLLSGDTYSRARGGEGGYQPVMVVGKKQQETGSKIHRCGTRLPKISIGKLFFSSNGFVARRGSKMKSVLSLSLSLSQKSSSLERCSSSNNIKQLLSGDTYSRARGGEGGYQPVMVVGKKQQETGSKIHRCGTRLPKISIGKLFFSSNVFDQTNTIKIIFFHPKLVYLSRTTGFKNEIFTLSLSLSLSLRNLLRLNDVAAATTSNNYFLVTRTVVLGAAKVVIRYDYGGGELEDGKHISEQSRYRLENSSFQVVTIHERKIWSKTSIGFFKYSRDEATVRFNKFGLKDSGNQEIKSEDLLTGPSSNKGM
ncbi:hypothetical protein QVD17_41623 [Tagetes erecta]|uniref:Uncharacterized protein n=1 Tax=Tagetes erecta TaxID=13708 RepID=A0AAD8JKX9_TARER|nr:hypothetical protein QVD17_41623 [Tagetes erecta]